MKQNTKKIFIILIATIFFSGSAFSVSATELNQQQVNKAHVYEVLPGSSEWDNMTPEEREDSCEVSLSEVQDMTTDALVETVLNYPYLINIYAYESLDVGIEIVSDYFPGLSELLLRNDAPQVLEKHRVAALSLLEGTDAAYLKNSYINSLQQYINDSVSESSNIIPYSGHQL